MNKKTFVVCCITALLAAGSFVVAQAPRVSEPAKTSTSSGNDPRLDKLIEQNEQILKTQEEILKKLDDLNTGIGQLRRRSS